MKIDLTYKEKLLKILTEDQIKFFEPLKKHTYTRLGGETDVFATPTTYDQLEKIIKLSKEYGVPVTLIGNGSNLIVKDKGIRGLTISLVAMQEIRAESNTIYAQSGAAIIDVSRYALAKNLSGLEFACGIPGTVGGALYMNAGAYGGQISDVLKSALLMNDKGERFTLSNEELSLEYRKSIISKKNYIVLEAEFSLEEASYEKIKAKMDENTFLRESKQPLEYPSCGSVFKRPPGYFAGKLIQDCGLQGLRIGGAEVSTKHAGFIVNVDNATAKDYTDLINIIQRTVKEKFAVDLETEVMIIGRDESDAD
ncbi:UDP-N-acetylenolpyruvoylglucosamine reductase [Bacillus sp. 7586-K]|uniref:UDP-N-acetylmuramate dehydrogenase n=1 Tax=Metabacillus niabensis TaxID=324854 RepID=UPI000BA553B4|nr:UDP-N-acetylenolpyruvoylglucosamine reductase [Bacillus sp. 7586-K]